MERKKGTLFTELLGLEPMPWNDWEHVKRFLANRYGIKPTNINAMAQCMAVELGFADRSIINNRKKVGAPNKWNISTDASRLFARLELESMQNPGVKKWAIAEAVRTRYDYQITAKRLQNLWTKLPLDYYVRLLLDSVHYSKMSASEKLQFLNAHSREPVDD